MSPNDGDAGSDAAKWGARTLLLCNHDGVLVAFEPGQSDPTGRATCGSDIIDLAETPPLFALHLDGLVLHHVSALRACAFCYSGILSHYFLPFCPLRAIFPPLARPFCAFCFALTAAMSAAQQGAKSFVLRPKLFDPEQSSDSISIRVGIARRATASTSGRCVADLDPVILLHAFLTLLFLHARACICCLFMR